MVLFHQQARPWFSPLPDNRRRGRAATGELAFSEEVRAGKDTPLEDSQNNVFNAWRCGPSGRDGHGGRLMESYRGMIDAWNLLAS